MVAIEKSTLVMKRVKQVKLHDKYNKNNKEYEEIKYMSRLYNSFEFVGNVHVPQDANKFHDVNTSSSGWESHRLNFSIQESKTNSVFLEVYGGFSKAKQNKVFSFSKGTENEKGSKLEIPWNDRLKEETVDMVADFKKLVVDFTSDETLKDEIGKLRYEIRTLEYKDELTEEEKEKVVTLKKELKEKAVDRHEFIHEYDAVLFLADNLEKYKGKKFKVTGRIEINAHKGNFYRKFKPESIELVSEEEPNKLRATMDIFFTNESLDEVDFEEEKKVYINGFIIDYDSKAKKDAFFPQQFVINANKIDFTNETHVKRFEFLKNIFKVEDEGVYHVQWLSNIFRGADSVEFTVDNLTDQQKEAVEFGISKLEDYAPKGGMLGETKEENRLVKPLLQEINKSNDFREGAALTSYTAEDLIYIAPTATPKQEESTPEEIEEVISASVDLDDLFA